MVTDRKTANNNTTAKRIPVYLSNNPSTTRPSPFLTIDPSSSSSSSHAPSSLSLSLRHSRRTYNRFPFRRSTFRRHIVAANLCEAAYRVHRKRRYKKIGDRVIKNLQRMERVSRSTLVNRVACHRRVDRSRRFDRIVRTFCSVLRSAAQRGGVVSTPVIRRRIDTIVPNGPSNARFQVACDYFFPG